MNLNTLRELSVLAFYHKGSPEEVHAALTVLVGAKETTLVREVCARVEATGKGFHEVAQQVLWEDPEERPLYVPFGM